MKKSLLLMVKGFIMGIANIIPGVSGGTLAIILGIYEDFIGALGHLLSNFKNNLKFLIPVGIGILISIASMSNVIDYSYNHFPLATTLFFIGLVIGGIPLLLNKVKGKKVEKKWLNVIIFIFTFSLVIFMACSDMIFDTDKTVELSNMNFIGYLKVFIVGIIAAATMVIPGVSGSLVLVLLGYYYPIVAMIKEIVHFDNLANNLVIAFIFGIGIIIGMVGISKLFEYLFKKQEVPTYYGVLGFIFASIIAIPISAFSAVTITFKVTEILVGILVFIIGCIVAYKLGDK